MVVYKINTSIFMMIISSGAYVVEYHSRGL